MADLDHLLAHTSRTFAAAIPLLPEPLRAQVTVAYLLLRIADTFEDAERWGRVARIEALERFCVELRAAGRGAAPGDGLEAQSAAWVAARPCENPHYLELLGEAPSVLAALRAFAPGPREAVARHALRTAEGMARVVARGDERGALALRSFEDLQAYCYLVAGIVGELLTDLFVLEQPALRAQREVLDAHAAAFGEGLQLVNILKDRGDDARDGRSYLGDEQVVRRAFAAAREDLERARVYVEALRVGGAHRGVVAFCALPVLLAREALRAVEGRGAGAKVGRAEVFALLAQLQRSLEQGEAPLRAS